MNPAYEILTYVDGATVRVLDKLSSAHEALALVQRAKSEGWQTYNGVPLPRPAFGEQVPIIWAEIVVRTKIS